MKAGKTRLECCSKPMLNLFCAVLATAVLCGRTAAQTRTDNWNGGSGQWSNAANWSLNAPPMTTDDCKFPPGSTPTDDLGGTCHDFTLVSGDTLTLNTGHLDIYGTSMTNSGTISVIAATPINIGGNTANTVSLLGGGTVVLGNANAAIVGFPGINGTLLNVNNTIQGFGGVGNGAIGLNNQGTITASGGTLTVQPSSTGLINTGTMQAASGGNLTLQAGFSSIPFTNTGGTIAALSGGTVVLNGGTFIGGTLSTTGTGTFQTSPGGGNPILSALTNAGNFTIPGGAAVILEGIETNTGSFQMQGSDLFVQGPATLQGAGNVTMTDSGFNLVGSSNGAATLTLAQTISGAGNVGDSNLTLVNQGTVDATGVVNHLIIAATSTTNSNALEATGGGTLELRRPVNNTTGTIEALNGSTVLLNGGTISGGTLTTSGTGSFQVTSGTLDGTTSVVTNSGAFIVANRNFLTLQGTINNGGVIALDSTGGCLALDKPTTLEGTGVVTMASASTNCFLASAPSDTLTNKSTIEGTGTIGDSNPMGITNAGTIIANQSTPLTIAPDAVLGFTNTGTLIVNSGSIMNINGPFKSLKSGALKSGTYSVAGILEFPNAIIKTSSGKIILTGAGAQIRDNGSLNNALIALVTNNGPGLLSLQSGATLTTTTNLTNKGKVTVGTGSSLTVNGYTQSGGTSTIDGTLTASSVTVQGGSTLGKGTLAAAVTSNGIITPGDSTTNPGVLAISGTYTQSATGTLKIYIAGAGAGQFGEVPVSNGVSLNGTLDLSRVHGFVPTIGSTFTLVTGSAITGQFATVNGTSINSSEHFQINYTATAVTASVVSGP
jgi:fibronectin-binding autotransporter adhesin